MRLPVRHDRDADALPTGGSCPTAAIQARVWLLDLDPSRSASRPVTETQHRDVVGGAGKHQASVDDGETFSEPAGVSLTPPNGQAADETTSVFQTPYPEGFGVPT